MTIQEFVRKFANPLSKEEIIQLRKQLDITECIEKVCDGEEIINALFSKFLSFDRLTRKQAIDVLSNFICTTGNSIFYVMDLYKEFLLSDGVKETDVESIIKLAYRYARETRERKIRKEHEQKRRLRFLKEKKEKYKALELERREKSLASLQTEVGFDTARFLIRNGFTYEQIKQTGSLQIFTSQEINKFLATYRVLSDITKEEVSIRDIVGFDYRFFTCGNDLLKAFPFFFDSSRKEQYYLRANSMLNLTTDDAMDVIEPSFKEEPMVVIEEGNGKYTIGTNGMHRYLILRSLYLMDRIHASDEKEKEELYKKYQMPVFVHKIDYLKTYAHYILVTLKIASYLTNEKDHDHMNTGRAEITLLNGEKIILNEEELFSYLQEMIRQKEKTEEMQLLWQTEDVSFLEFLATMIDEEYNKHR